jgi:hypothetical protein
VSFHDKGGREGGRVREGGGREGGRKEGHTHTHTYINHHNVHTRDTKDIHTAIKHQYNSTQRSTFHEISHYGTYGSFRRKKSVNGHIYLDILINSIMPQNSYRFQ